MAVILGVVLGLGVLYYWLSGHWFARIIVFILLAGVAAVVGIGINVDGNGLAFFLVGTGAAWPLSGIPTYWYRHRAREASMALTLR